jgi:hypothetical protein
VYKQAVADITTNTALSGHYSVHNDLQLHEAGHCSERKYIELRMIQGFEDDFLGKRLGRGGRYHSPSSCTD